MSTSPLAHLKTFLVDTITSPPKDLQELSVFAQKSLDTVNIVTSTVLDQHVQEQQLQNPKSEQIISPLSLRELVLLSSILDLVAIWTIDASIVVPLHAIDALSPRCVKISSTLASLGAKANSLTSTAILLSSSCFVLV